MTPTLTTSRLLAALAAAGIVLAGVCAYVGSWTNVVLVAAYVALALYAARVNGKRLEAHRRRSRARRRSAARVEAWVDW